MDSKTIFFYIPNCLGACKYCQCCNFRTYGNSNAYGNCRTYGNSRSDSSAYCSTHTYSGTHTHSDRGNYSAFRIRRSYGKQVQIHEFATFKTG